VFSNTKKLLSIKEIWLVCPTFSKITSFDTEDEATRFFKEVAVDITVEKNWAKHSLMQKALEITWDVPLPKGERYHKRIPSPVKSVIYNGAIRQYALNLSPQLIEFYTKTWLDPLLDNWYVKQYVAAEKNQLITIVGEKETTLQALCRVWGKIPTSQLLN